MSFKRALFGALIMLIVLVQLYAAMSFDLDVSDEKFIIWMISIIAEAMAAHSILTETEKELTHDNK